MKQNDKAQPAIDGAFLRSIQEYRNGETLTELSEALRKVTVAALTSGKTASLTMKLIVKPTGGAVQLQSEITTRAPKPATPVGVFFVDEQNNLTRRDPNQQEMQLRTVEAPQGHQGAPLRQAVGE